MPRTTLAESHPHLVAEWDFERNLAMDPPLTPDTITTGSNKKVWWICSAHGPFLMKVGNRTRGQGCPKCAGRLGTTLAESHPHLVAEWDFERNLTLDTPLAPDTVATASGKKAWWICPTHGPYLQKVAHRTTGGGCPKCAGKLRTTLAESHPHLVVEWDFERNLTLDTPLAPDTVATASRKKAWWNCDKHGPYLQSIQNRTGHDTGCPTCIGRLGTSLAESHPHLVAEWDFERNLAMDPPLTPDTIPTGSNKKVGWICPVHGPYLKSLVDRAKRDGGCPKCAGRLGTTLAESHPHLVAEWDFERNILLDPSLAPDTIATGSGRKVNWICKRCGHRWLTTVNIRTRMGTGCKECFYRSRRTSPKKTFDATGRKGASRKSPRRTTRGGSPFDIGPRRPNPILRKDLRQLIASGIFEYFNIPYEVAKTGYPEDIDCRWTGGVVRILPQCTVGQIIHEIAHFLVSPESSRFEDDTFNLSRQGWRYAGPEELQTLLLAYLIMKQLGFYDQIGDDSIDRLEYLLDVIDGRRYLRSDPKENRKLRRAFNRLGKLGLLDTPYTRDFAPLLDTQLRLLSRGKLERFV